jgi:hypothetical protein
VRLFDDKRTNENVEDEMLGKDMKCRLFSFGEEEG